MWGVNVQWGRLCSLLSYLTKRFAPLFLLGLLADCSSPAPTPDPPAQSAAGGQQSAPGRSVADIRKDTDENIQSINVMIPTIPNEVGIGFPKDIDGIKKKLPEFHANQWVDGETGKPLAYDPTTKTVSRAK